MSSMAYEINFEGLAGMTHHYGGLAYGNLPSMQSIGKVSRPKEAALQGLQKMALLNELGVRQAVLPPHERPFFPLLEQLGFSGTKQNRLDQVKKEAPWLLPILSSSAAMWTANWATSTASIDSSDAHAHFTPANLASYLHRSLEPSTTQRILKAIFPSQVFFKHHPPLPCGGIFFDEGSANQIRFAKNYRSPGVYLFVFGKSTLPSEMPTPSPHTYPARQSKEASEALPRIHGLYPNTAVYAYQHPEAIDAGIFHNDLIAQGNLHFLMVHEKAFWNQQEVLNELKKKFSERCDEELKIVEVLESQVPLKEAASSFMFNSQIVTLPDLTMALIAPEACRGYDRVTSFFESLVKDPAHPVNTIHYVNLSESLGNGGGPACLRLRVVLTENELAHINPAVLYSPRLHERLESWIHKHYPDTLSKEELAKTELHEKNCQALDELCTILELGKVYPFQLGTYG